MELSALLMLGAGRLVGASLIGRLPGIAVFGAGLIAGWLAIALVGWLAGRSQNIRSGAALDLATSAGVRTAPDSAKLMPGEAARWTRQDVGHHRPIGRQTDGSGVGTAQYQDQHCHAPSLRIGLLGSLTVNGQAGALMPAQSQLIVALALNRNGLSNRQLRSLLGAHAGHPKPADSLRQLI